MPQSRDEKTNESNTYLQLHLLLNEGTKGLLVFHKVLHCLVRQACVKESNSIIIMGEMLIKIKTHVNYSH